MTNSRRFARNLASSLPLLLLATLLAACGGAPQHPAEPPVPKTLPELQKQVEAILTRTHVPGVGIALVDKDHVIWAGGVGMARLASHEAVTADTMFRVGSITKSLVALALLKLQEEKRIDLNAKLLTVAPTLPFQNRWRSSDPITVADVLEHTAGFDDMSLSEVYSLNPDAEIDPLDVCRRFSLPLIARWPPGTRMSYSNPGYGVAGFLVRITSNLKFDQDIEQNVLQPLGMTVSGFNLNTQIYKQLAQGYDGNPPHPVPYLNIYLRSAGDLKSSPAELAKLVQMFLNRGKVGDQQFLTPDSITRMEYPQTTLAARAGLKNGYGLANYSSFDGPVVQHGHDGGISGFLSTYRYMPDQGVGYVALINSDSGGEALREIDNLLARYLLAGQPLPPPPNATVPASQLAQFAGYYEKENPREQMLAFLDVLLGGRRVWVSGSQLYMKGWLGPTQQLVPTGNNQFRLEKQPAPSMIFLTDSSGNQILAAPGAAGFFGERRGEFWPALRLVLIVLALAAMLSSIGFAFWWIPRRLLGKMKTARRLLVRVMPLLAIASLVGAYELVSRTPVWVLGNYNISSVGVWLCTWLFAVFSVVGLVLAWRARWQPVHRAVYWHSLIVSLACCGLSLYLAYWHLIGIKLWQP
jgi:CubicO group peptidase (beta-lactamase class C family)